MKYIHHALSPNRPWALDYEQMVLGVLRQAELRWSAETLLARTGCSRKELKDAIQGLKAKIEYCKVHFPGCLTSTASQNHYIAIRADEKKNKSVNIRRYRKKAPTDRVQDRRVRRRKVWETPTGPGIAESGEK